MPPHDAAGPTCRINRALCPLLKTRWWSGIYPCVLRHQAGCYSGLSHVVTCTQLHEAVRSSLERSPAFREARLRCSDMRLCALSLLSLASWGRLAAAFGDFDRRRTGLLWRRNSDLIIPHITKGRADSCPLTPPRGRDTCQDKREIEYCQTIQEAKQV